MIRNYFRWMSVVVLFLVFGVLQLPGQAANQQNAKPAGQAAHSAAKTSPSQGAAKPAANPENEHDLADSDLKAIKQPPLPAFHPQEPKRIQLSNGMVIFLQEDHELPLIEGTALIRGGSTAEPADKIGLISIYAGSWRTGGTKTRTGDQLDDQLEARAANVETGGGSVSTTLRLSCLKQDFDTVLDVFNDVLRNPEFRQEKIDLAKDGVRTGIVRRNDNLGQIAGRESAKLGYGAQSAYARVPEYATVNAVTRQDLLDWHNKYVHPNNIILGMTGDFDSAQMEARLRKLFVSWPEGPAYNPPKIAVNPPVPGVYFVSKEDVNQSEIRMVSPGIRRDDPDFYAVEVLNQVFGGGFGSRLFVNLRTKAGLAYAVGGGVDAAYDHPGLTRLSMGTKSGTTVQAVEGMYAEINDMHTRPATGLELQRGKDAILNSFVFEFDSKDKVLQERMVYELYGYPADFLERYRKGVEAVTAADVDRVAKKYLVKDKLAVLVVGKAADFDKQLDTFGKVTPIDITIPQPGSASSAASAPAASNPEGKALVAKVIDAAGGAKLNSIKALRSKVTLTLKEQGMSIEAEETEVLPDKVRTTMTTPGGVMVMVVSPQDSFMQMGAMGTRPMPSAQKEDSLNGLRRNIWYVAQHISDPQYIFAANGTEKVNGVDATVLDIRAGELQWRWYVDPKTAHIVRAQYEGTGQSGPETRTVDFSEWKTVDGVTLPYHEELATNGKPAITIVTSSYELNPAIDPKAFQKSPDAGGGDQK
jgi:zinc protease